MGRKKEVLDDETETQELPGIPPASPLGKACKAYRKASEKMDNAITSLKEEKGDCKQRVIDELKSAKLTSVSIDGYLYELRHIEETDDIVIKKPRVK